MDKKAFDKFAGEALIKTTDVPLHGLPGDEKAKLNRKGNELFNRGELETARRIFQTTGYSDGLIRVGDKYLEGRRPVDALKMYWLARDEKRSNELVELAVLAIQKLLRDKEEENERPSEPRRISEGPVSPKGSPES
jgi:hypothetical protein